MGNTLIIGEMNPIMRLDPWAFVVVSIVILPAVALAQRRPSRRAQRGRARERSDSRTASSARGAMARPGGHPGDPGNRHARS